VPEHVIADAYAEDESVAAAEYGAQFRRDLESYVSLDVLTRLITPGVRERGPSWTNRYVAFADPAGGAGGDSMTLAISHHDRGADTVLLDVLREARPPFNPERVVEEFAEVLDRYRVRVVVGDRYGGDWPAAAFRRHHIVYKPADRTRSEIYRDVLPLLTSGAVELLDDSRLTRQLLVLERRTTMGGRDAIDHPAGAHDDVANAAAGALLLASEGRRRGLGFRSDVGEIRVVPADRGLDLPTARDVRIRQF
jgi:hypothetical protein